MTALSTRDALAQAIRIIDGNHDLGAAALADALIDGGHVVDVTALADDDELVNTVAQGMTLESFEDMPLTDVLALRGHARATLLALAAALTERAS